MGQILCLAAQSAPLRVYRSGKYVFPKVAGAERSSKERLTEGGGDSRPMSGVFSQRGFWKFAFWLLGKEDTHGNRGMCHASLGKVWLWHGTEHMHPQNYRIRSVSLKAFRTGQVDLPFSDKGTKLALFSSDWALSLHSYSEGPTLNHVKWFKNRSVWKSASLQHQNCQAAEMEIKWGQSLRGRTKWCASPKKMGPEGSPSAIRVRNFWRKLWRSHLD